MLLEQVVLNSHLKKAKSPICWIPTVLEQWLTNFIHSFRLND